LRVHRVLSPSVRWCVSGRVYAAVIVTPAGIPWLPRFCCCLAKYPARAVQTRTVIMASTTHTTASLLRPVLSGCTGLTTTVGFTCNFGGATGACATPRWYGVVLGGAACCLTVGGWPGRVAARRAAVANSAADFQRCRGSLAIAFSTT